MSKYSKQFLENIIKSSSNPIFVKDANLRFVLVNDAFTRMTGIEAQDILGKDDYDFFPAAQADVFKAIDEVVLNTGEENFNEEKLLGPDGVTLTLNTGKNCITDELGNRYIVGNIYNTTEKKQLIDNLKVSNQMLERYAHLVSHDLKSPIITIHRFAQLLSRSLVTKLTTTETEYLDFITSSSLRLFELVQKILDFSHLNMQELHLVKVDANELLADVKSDLRVLIEDGDCLLDIERLPDGFFCDKRLLNSVFQNLISNAIKFRVDDKACVVKVTCDQVDNAFLFTVADNGIGVDEEEQEEIFEMFARLSSNPNVLGSGIGLALSKMIVERHGGKIWVESELGKGCQFKFTIPQDINIPIQS
ncbi:MAG: ATP-binding protein [Saprospiraceae bacterium]